MNIDYRNDKKRFLSFRDCEQGVGLKIENDDGKLNLAIKGSIGGLDEHFWYKKAKKLGYEAYCERYENTYELDENGELVRDAKGNPVLKKEEPATKDEILTAVKGEINSLLLPIKEANKK